MRKEESLALTRRPVRCGVGQACDYEMVRNVVRACVYACACLRKTHAFFRATKSLSECEPTRACVPQASMALTGDAVATKKVSGENNARGLALLCVEHGQRRLR
jgi:hypothetical protein